MISFSLSGGVYMGGVSINGVLKKLIFGHKNDEIADINGLSETMM